MQPKVKRTQHLITIGVASILVMCLSLSGVAQAALVTFNFEGRVIAPVHPALSGTIFVNTPFSGSYSFESTTPDLRPLEGNVGQYAYSALSINLLGTTYSMDLTGASHVINVVNLADPQNDGYAVLLSRTSPPAQAFSLQLAGPGLFSGDALPVMAPGLSGLTANSVQMGGFGPLGAFTVQGQLTSLTVAPVPLPGAFLLFGSSLIGLVGLGVRRRIEKR